MDQAERELQLVFASLEPFGPEDLKPPPAKTEVQAAPREAPPPPPQAPPAGTDWLRVALWTGGAFVLGILLHLLLRWLGRKAERQP
ncbi:MAG: hypothetical protein M5U26_02840 [Planctomycetota bacterium]|nr:hypothetical protein [Planctomycetota bacterium]